MGQEFEGGKAARLLSEEIEQKLDAILSKLDNPDDPVVTEDLGTHTNPEKFKVDNSFRSQVITRAGGIATALWTPTAGVANQPRRTSGKKSYVYWIRIYNHSGAPVTAWLEIGGVQVTITYPLDSGQTVTENHPLPLPMGDNNINCNASANNVNFQIGGYEI